MGPILIFTGLMFTVAGVRGTHGEMFSLLGEELLGSENEPGFAAIAVAVGSAAALGYVPGMRNVSTGLTALIFVGLVAAYARKKNPAQVVADYVTQGTQK